MIKPILLLKSGSTEPFSSFRVLYLFLLFSIPTFGQELLTGTDATSRIPGTVLIRYSTNRSAPDFIRLSSQKRLATNEGLEWISKALKLSPHETLILQRSETDKLQMQHDFYQHVYKGLPVMHSQYRIHSKNGYIESFNGEFYTLPEINNSPTLSAEEAKIKAKESVHADQYIDSLFPIANPELVIAPTNGDYKKNDFKLCWKVDVFGLSPLTRNWVFVDAQTGAIVWTTPSIYPTDTPGSAETAYYGNKTIITDSTANGYILKDNGRGNGIHTINEHNDGDFMNDSDFEDADNFWGSTTPNALDQYALDAHWGMEMTYDYFLNFHGRNSIDNQGYELKGYVHFGQNIANAFWGGQILYGDGNGVYFDRPLTGIVVTGHEITHGLIEYTADLVYQFEPGALNESFADIFGVTVEHAATGNSSSSLWKLLEESRPNGTPMRSMDNPNETQCPDTYLGLYWFPDTSTADAGGVHTNSGVQNFWYYLMCEGGVGTNDNGLDYSVNGIGIENAANIAYRNLTVYLGAFSQYSDAAFYAVQSAIDIFGNCSPEMNTTDAAWKAVGVDPQYLYVEADFITDITGLSVSFYNTSIGVTNAVWDFGDGTTSGSYDPVHLYSSPGTYTVMLIATDDICSDTMLMTVNVDSGLGMEENNPELLILISPIPFNDALAIEVNGITAETNLNIYAINALNQKVADIFNGTAQKENETFVWTSPSGLAPGVYFIRIEQGSNRTTRRVVKY